MDTCYKYGVKGSVWKNKKYSDKWIKRLAVKLLQYASEAEIPFKQEFATRNKFSSQRLSEFTKIPLFADALKRFEDVQTHKIVSSAMKGKINTTMAIFTLKNVAGWRDAPTEKEASEFINQTIIINTEDKIENRVKQFVN